MKLTEDQEKQILAKLKEVESLVDVELIPMIVKRSSVVRHVPVLIFLVLLFLIFLIDLKSRFWLPWYFEVVLMVALIVGFFFLSLSLAKIPFLQRFLTSDADEEIQVQNRAELEFFRGKFHRTEKRDAILLMLSLMEQRAFIYSDENVKALFSDDEKAKIKEVLSQGLKKGAAHLAFIDAMELILSVLKTKAPKTQGKGNEMPDKIYIKD